MPKTPSPTLLDDVGLRLAPRVVIDPKPVSLAEILAEMTRVKEDAEAKRLQRVEKRREKRREERRVKYGSRPVRHPQQFGVAKSRLFDSEGKPARQAWTVIPLNHHSLNAPPERPPPRATQKTLKRPQSAPALLRGAPALATPQRSPQGSPDSRRGRGAPFLATPQGSPSGSPDSRRNRASFRRGFEFDEEPPPEPDPWFPVSHTSRRDRDLGFLPMRNTPQEKRAELHERVASRVRVLKEKKREKEKKKGRLGAEDHIELKRLQGQLAELNLWHNPSRTAKLAKRAAAAKRRESLSASRGRDDVREILGGKSGEKSSPSCSVGRSPRRASTPRPSSSGAATRPSRTPTTTSTTSRTTRSRTRSRAASRPRRGASPWSSPPPRRRSARSRPQAGDAATRHSGTFPREPRKRALPPHRSCSSSRTAGGVYSRAGHVYNDTEVQPAYSMSISVRSAARSFADRARGLRSTSPSGGGSAFRCSGAKGASLLP